MNNIIRCKIQTCFFFWMCSLIWVLRAENVDVCTCLQDGYCVVGDAVVLTREPCENGRGKTLRVSGDGFVAGIDFTDDGLREVFIQRSTVTCADAWKHFKGAVTIALNGTPCQVVITSTSIPTKVCRAIFFCLQTQKKLIA